MLTHDYFLIVLITIGLFLVIHGMGRHGWKH